MSRQDVLRQSTVSLKKSRAGPEQISESGEAARLRAFLQESSQVSSTRSTRFYRPVDMSPSNDQLISRTSSSASTASTASILRTPSRVPSISCTSSSASSSSKSSVVTFSWAASTAQWEGLPGQGPWVAPAPSKRWIADSKQPEGARSSRQAKSEARLRRTDNHGQGKPTKHDAATRLECSAAISSDVEAFDLEQNLEQLKAAIHRRYKYRRQNFDPFQVVKPPTRDSQERKSERKAFGLTQAKASDDKARFSCGAWKIGP
mmetsp:Transcript_24190/g.38979  ORF Transcript_24190/g.38979 Transcript_24190/m.38979 type:complete len:261 (-) Transcript_24190:82-864(-)